MIKGGREKTVKPHRLFHGVKYDHIMNLKSDAIRIDSHDEVNTINNN